MSVENAPKPLVFFVDRCLGRKVFNALKQAGLTVKFHDDEFAQGTEDQDWLLVVGQRGWIVLTKDQAIGRNSIERIAVASANVRFFTLNRQDCTGAEMADIFCKAIGAMQNFIRKHPAPFMAKVNRAGKVEGWRDRDELLREISS
ncbi:MAG: hypothetical protein BJG00_010545 [Limnothrix sp. CACIAM 69d]|nr:MAG: hypothetical protein BJG00_010545 [Limnothrix sp. CACIAM 69d]